MNNILLPNSLKVVVLELIIPENYDPKLREQLPDIINKTGIDINSLT
jgi:hypothetical protein